MAQKEVGIVGKVILVAITFALATFVWAFIIKVVAGAGFNVTIPWWNAVGYGAIASIAYLVIKWFFSLFR